MWNEETGKFDQHEDGIVRLEIMRLQKLRKIYKDQRPKDQNDSMYNVFDILQYAVKVMALTFYGELGRGPSKKSPQGSRLYIRNAAEFITLKGRELIEEAARIVYNNYNAPLIYGDTDSIYIKIPSPLDSAGKSFISGLISNIVHDINRGYAELLTREGINIDHQTVEMEVQGYYPRFYLTAAKKKYIYYLAYDGNVWYDPWKFGYTGMDFKRRETVPFIGKLQKKVCRMVLDLKDIDYIGRFIYSYRKRLFSGKMNKHLIFTYNLTKDLDDYKANTMYVRAARKARDLGVQELKYISYVVTDIKKNKKTVVPILNTEIPKMTYDAYSYYWGRLISTMQNTLEPLIDPMKLEAKLLGRGVLFETL
jgi:DNA polymerase elongation subunit (family B)